MSTAELAQNLLDRAAADELAAHRIQSGDDIPRLRVAIRTLARQRKVRIRTAVIDDVLAVVRADASIWNDPTATMKAKLTPGSPGTLPTRRAAPGPHRDDHAPEPDYRGQQVAKGMVGA